MDGDRRSLGSGLQLAAAWDAPRASRASCLWSRGCWRRILRYACVDLSHRPEASPHSDKADGLLAGLRAVSTNAQLQASAQASRLHGFDCLINRDYCRGRFASLICAPAAVTTSGLAVYFSRCLGLCPAPQPLLPLSRF